MRISVSRTYGTPPIRPPEDRKTPMVYNNHGRKLHEHMLRLCDELAQRFGGEVQAEIDFEQRRSWICVTLPGVRFQGEGKRFLDAVIDMVEAAEFAAAPDGRVCLRLETGVFRPDSAAAEKNTFSSKDAPKGS